MKGFGSDNHAGTHPELLNAMLACNQDHAPSYGTDHFSHLASEAFAELFAHPVRPWFVYNGTSANVLALRCMTRPWQAVLCAEIAHINVDECAAPEGMAGVKLIGLPTVDGKLQLTTLQQALIRRGDQHYCQPQVVSLTQPTEVGTCYSVQEIKAICDWAHQQNLYVHIDGARIANAVVSCKSSFKEMFTDTGVDAISFGGTKNGLMFGEAVLFFNAQLRKQWGQDAHYARKQMGQLPSKTRFIAAPFAHYIRSGLWQTLAQEGIRKAKLMATLVAEIPEVKIIYPVQSNAVFAEIPQAWVKSLREKFFFYVWDEKTFACRWMISFDTLDSEIEAFAQELKLLSKTKHE